MILWWRVQIRTLNLPISVVVNIELRFLWLGWLPFKVRGAIAERSNGQPKSAVTNPFVVPEKVD